MHLKFHRTIRWSHEADKTLYIFYEKQKKPKLNYSSPHVKLSLNKADVNKPIMLKRTNTILSSWKKEDLESLFKLLPDA